MFSDGKNKRLFWIILVVCCLAFAGTVQADWEEQDKLLASDGANEDYFGHSVSISWDYAIIGAYYDDDKGDSSGSAYIFKRNDSDPNWTEQDKLTASDGAAGDRLGYSVSISGDYAIVGAYGDDSRMGSAYIFKRNDSDPNWTQLAKLTASDGVAEDRFGYAVSIDGDYAVAGAYKDDSSLGAAYIFEKPGGGWVNANETAKLTASDGVASDEFGKSVSIDEDYVIISTPTDDDKGTNSGSAYIFEKPGGGWVNTTETAKVTASDGSAFDYFGKSVSISGSYAIIGADMDDPNGMSSGSAYIFKRNDSDPNWTQQAKLTASDGQAEDWFGCSVSISGNCAIVGAYDEERTELERHSGAAYVFEMPDTGWEDANETAKLKASDATDHEYFGKSVSISECYVLIGAEGHNGSAYVFKNCIIADLNEDCFIDFIDYAIFANQWLATGCGAPEWCDGADLDESTEVNLVDLDIFTDYWLD